MDAIGAYDILKLTIIAVLWSTAPVLAGALVVGLGIAFLQALTQVQELTLTFVPKIVAIFFLLVLFVPFMYQNLSQLSAQIFDLIVSGSN